MTLPTTEHCSRLDVGTEGGREPWWHQRVMPELDLIEIGGRQQSVIARFVNERGDEEGHPYSNIQLDMARLDARRERGDSFRATDMEIAIRLWTRNRIGDFERSTFGGRS